MGKELPKYWYQFICFFSKYLWSAYSVPGTVLGSGDTTVNKTDKTACIQGAYTLAEGQAKQEK